VKFCPKFDDKYIDGYKRKGGEKMGSNTAVNIKLFSNIKFFPIDKRIDQTRFKIFSHLRLNTILKGFNIGKIFVDNQAERIVRATLNSVNSFETKPILDDVLNSLFGGIKGLQVVVTISQKPNIYLLGNKKLIQTVDLIVEKAELDGAKKLMADLKKPPHVLRKEIFGNE